MSPGRQKNDSSFMGPCQGPGDGDGDEGITFCDEQIQDIGFRIAPAECSEQSSAPLALCGDVLEELGLVSAFGRAQTLPPPLIGTLHMKNVSGAWARGIQEMAEQRDAHCEL